MVQMVCMGHEHRNSLKREKRPLLPAAKPLKKGTIHLGGGFPLDNLVVAESSSDIYGKSHDRETNYRQRSPARVRNLRSAQNPD